MTDNTRPPVDKYRLRLKIGLHEFEAEAPGTVIQSHLTEFKQLISETPRGPETAETSPKVASRSTQKGSEKLVFSADFGQKTVVLRILPSTDKGRIRQIANTMLLLLYGFQEELAETEIAALRLASAVRQSGLVQTNRLSTAFQRLESDGHAIKIGQGRGTRYRLTKPGADAAVSLIQATFSKSNFR